MNRKNHVAEMTAEDKLAIINDSVQAVANRPNLSPAEMKKKFVQVIVNEDGTPNIGEQIDRIAREAEAAIEEVANEIDNAEAIKAINEKLDTLTDEKQDAVTFDGTYDKEENPAATVETVTETVTAAKETIEADIAAYKKTSTETVNGVKDELKTLKEKSVPLGEDGKIPSMYLPSFVDDVIEVDDYNNLPKTGETGKIYVTTNDNKQYRWGGTGYAIISESLALGETDSTAYPGHLGKANAEAIMAVEKNTAIDEETIVRNENGQMVLCERYVDYLEEKLYLAPAVSVFTLSGLSSLYEIGQRISPTAVTHRETHITNIQGTLSLQVNNVQKTTLSPTAEQKTIALGEEASVVHHSPATVIYKLQGTNTRGGTFNLQRTCTVAAPFFIGVCNDESVTAEEITVFKKQTLKAAVAGTYTVTVEDGYIYFCCSTWQKINGITSSGFTVPIEYVGDVTGVDINGVSVTYKTYRTANKVVAGTYTYVIT